MIFTIESAKMQVEKLIQKYQGLSIVESSDSLIRLNGSILVHRVLNDFPLRKAYALDVCIPIGSDELPYIVDCAKEIDEAYHHRYPDGKLCLETDSKIRIRFINGFNLLEWMDEFVEPYFVSYEYYQLFGQFPNGERSHGMKGILESYQELLCAKDIVETFRLMLHIKETPYRGHLECPCDSGFQMRKCHGKWMLPFYSDERMKKIMLEDLNCLEVLLDGAKKD